MVSWVRCVLVFHPEMIANTRMLHEVIRRSVRCVLVFHPEMIANTRMLHEVIRQWLRFYSFTQRQDIVAKAFPEGLSPQKLLAN